MSSSVSQLDYWRETKKAANETNKNVTEGGPGASYLSYDVFLGLSVLGGFFALDHLYLRSPLTFLAKLVINILFLGVWWIYDASQAIFNKDVVKVFGVSIPGLAPSGIAAGVLGSDVPDKKHMAFFIYGLALMLGGIFGLDSFIVGDKQSGFIRLICLITGILAPVAIFWWLFNLFKFFFKTKDVTSMYFDYFGAPPPPEYTMSFGEKLVTKFPILQTILGPVKKPENISKPPSGILESVVAIPLEIAGSVASKFVEPLIEPVLGAVKPYKNTINSGIQTVDDGIKLAQSTLNTTSAIASQAIDTAGKTANAATKALTLVPGAAALTSGFTPAAAEEALKKLAEDKITQQLTQQGGSNNSSILPFVLIGTFAAICVSGLILTYRRSRQNEQPRKDDSPPEPRVLPKSDKEESN
jgi:hypothetical protein